MDGLPVADEAMQAHARSLTPGVRKSTVTVVRARRLGDDRDDDGDGGVREPRRPLPPTDHDAVEAQLPEGSQPPSGA